MYDDLTGAYNRRQIIELAEREFERALRHDTDLSIMMIDIDHFKKVNDTYGHFAGDQALVRIAQELKIHLRAGDITGRLGGDEFLIILPCTTSAEARELADRLRHLVNQVCIDADDDMFCFSISVGVSTITDDISNLLELISIADRLLYSAKSAGRNQVRVS
ncbi:MAG: GGDEF domain-containing protein [Gammaproteobacteria bacterium]